MGATPFIDAYEMLATLAEVRSENVKAWLFRETNAHCDEVAQILKREAKALRNKAKNGTIYAD